MMISLGFIPLFLIPKGEKKQNHEVTYLPCKTCFYLIKKKKDKTKQYRWSPRLLPTRMVGRRVESLSSQSQVLQQVTGRLDQTCE